VFRTRCINPAFAHHKLILKQKDLLHFEQVFAEIDRIPFGGGRGILIEHLDGIFSVLRQILNK